MPELPEVQTTVRGILRTAKDLTIVDQWTDLASTLKQHVHTIKNRDFALYIKKSIVGAQIISAERVGKNILIHLSSEHTIIVHMKMTGHILYGKYTFDSKNNCWKPQEKNPQHPLNDPFNRFIHVVWSLSNGYSLALSDMRKFARVTLTLTEHLQNHTDHIGPDPLSKGFTKNLFIKIITKNKTKKPIKALLLNQEIISGIGNIYADESLWRAGIHPKSIANKIPMANLNSLYIALKKTLSQGIDFGGDSMSDYRNIYGERGKFQEHHRAYRKTDHACSYPKCSGIIQRIVIQGRGTHFCSHHQKLWI